MGAFVSQRLAPAKHLPAHIRIFVVSGLSLSPGNSQHFWNSASEGHHSGERCNGENKLLLRKPTSIAIQSLINTTCLGHGEVRRSDLPSGQAINIFCHPMVRPAPVMRELLAADMNGPYHTYIHTWPYLNPPAGCIFSGWTDRTPVLASTVCASIRIWILVSIHGSTLAELIEGSQDQERELPRNGSINIPEARAPSPPPLGHHYPTDLQMCCSGKSASLGDWAQAELRTPRAQLLFFRQLQTWRGFHSWTNHGQSL